MLDGMMRAFTVRAVTLFSLLLPLGLLIGCETNPYTGRSQFLMTSMSDEMQMGAQAYNQVKTDPKMKQSQDPREIEPVKRVAARIIEAAKRSKYAEMAQQFQWEVTVFKDDKTANAFARHGGERMSQGEATNIGIQVLGAAAGVGTGNAALGQATMAALGVGAQVGMLLPFSRKHESEADYIGILLAADAGYDPRESVALWERMARMSGGGAPPEFMSTHPSNETRIDQLKKWMPEAMAIYQSKPSAPAAELPPIGR